MWARALGRGRDEELRAGDDLEPARVVLANPRLVIVEAIEMDQQLHVALEAEQRVLRERVEWREKDASAHKPVVHRLVLLSGIRVRNRSKSPAWREAACGDSGRVAPCLEPRLPIRTYALRPFGSSDRPGMTAPRQLT